VDPRAILRIFDHLGLWAPVIAEQIPPLGPANWLRFARMPLTIQFPASPDLWNGSNASELQGCGKALAAPRRLE